MLHPPGSRCWKKQPGSDRVKTKTSSAVLKNSSQELGRVLKPIAQIRKGSEVLKTTATALKVAGPIEFYLDCDNILLKTHCVCQVMQINTRCRVVAWIAHTLLHFMFCKLCLQDRNNAGKLRIVKSLVDWSWPVTQHILHSSAGSHQCNWLC